MSRDFFIENYVDCGLKSIYQSDPVAELAAALIEQGITEGELCAALKKVDPRVPDALRLNLHNSYRDVAAGIPTTNKWGVLCKQKPKQKPKPKR